MAQCASDEDGPTSREHRAAPLLRVPATRKALVCLDAPTAGCRGQSHPARGVSLCVSGQQECTADRTGAAQGEGPAVLVGTAGTTLVPSRAKEASGPGIRQNLH